MREKKMRCRIEELPLLAQLTRNLFVRDRNDFISFSTIYNNHYLIVFDDLVKCTNESISPGGLTSKMKLISEKIIGYYTKLRDVLNITERYAELASTELTVKPADLGFKSIRREITLEKDSSVIFLFRELMKQVNLNFKSFEDKGFTKSYFADIYMLIGLFEKDCKQYRQLKAEREDHVKVNNIRYDNLWNLISDIIDTGKTIYRQKDRTRLSEYNYIALITKVRQIQLLNNNTLRPGEMTKFTKEMNI